MYSLGGAAGLGGGAVAAGAPFVLVGAPGDYVFGGEGEDIAADLLFCFCIACIKDRQR